MKRVMAGLLTVAALGLGSVAVSAKMAKPDATLELRGGSIAAGAGVSWGHGSLSYHGKRFTIAAEGFDVGEVGVTKMNAAGKVYNLKRLEDFDGTYVAVAAEATVGGGAGVVAMENQNGVRVNIVSTTQGANLALGVDGVKLKVKR